MARNKGKTERGKLKKIEDLIQRACQAVRSGECEDVKAAASKYKAPYYTVRNRYLKKTSDRFTAQERQQLLTNSQERILVNWIMYLGASGHACKKANIYPKVASICGKAPGKTWMEAFMARHPEIKLVRPTGLDPKRARAFNPTTVQKHFDLLKGLLEEHDIPWENVYNMDEKGIQLGGGRKGRREKYFFARSERVNLKLQASNLVLVTIAESVCADGTYCPPGFIFPGSSFCPEWFDEGDDTIYLVSVTENGWTDDFVCSQWFEKTFIPFVLARNKSGKPILLILDGHGSHLTDKMVELALKHNILLYCLPPHCTHRLQPLDVGVFGPLQRLWEQRCDEVADITAESMRIQDVVKNFLEVREASYKRETILKAWEKTGICPFNPSIFVPSDFAPSHDTSTNVHLPATYPTHMAHMPDMSSDDFEWTADAPDVATVDGNESDGSLPCSDPPSDDENQSDSDCDTVVDPDSDTEQTSLKACASEPVILQDGVRSSRKRRRSPSLSSDTSVEEGPSHAGRSPVKTRMLSRMRSEAQVLTSKSRITTLNQARVRIDQLEEELYETSVQLQAANTHCVMAAREIGTLKARANKKSQKTEKRFRVDATCVTSGEGLRAWREEKAARDEKARKDLEKRKEKEAAAVEREAERNRLAVAGTFTGSLNSKNKGELQDISAAFGISKDGTKANLAERILEHMDAHPELEKEPRFVGLFSSRSRGSAAATRRMTQATNPEPASAPLPQGEGTSTTLPILDAPVPNPTSNENIDPTLL